MMPPCSEALGRHNPYLYSTAIYSIACLLVGVVPHIAGVFIGRFFSGFASAVPSVVLAGSIEDLFGDGTHPLDRLSFRTRASGVCSK